MGAVLIAITGVLFGSLGFFWYYVAIVVLGDWELSERLPDFYWGKNIEEEGRSEDAGAFHKIDITVDESLAEAVKAKVKDEINSGRFHSPFRESGFQYGFNQQYLLAVVNHWLYQYDWLARQQQLNSIPQFKTRISGLEIHFRQVEREAPKDGADVPKHTILLIHGWPGSFVEFQHLIQYLIDPQNLRMRMEVISPSIPGFGFSEVPTTPGLGPAEIAQIFVKLMARLGHLRFYVYASGWGSLIASSMVTLFPESVIGLHSTFCMSDHPRSHFKMLLSLGMPSLYYSGPELRRRKTLTELLRIVTGETGHLLAQTSKPDTVGTGPSVSPNALAAHILEKFSAWSGTFLLNEQDGGLPGKFNLDDLLDNVMVYYVTNTITPSMRFFSEAFSERQRSYGLHRIPVKVPTGCLVPPNDPLLHQSRSMIQDKFHNLIHWEIAEDGGHFMSLEHPDALAEDILAFVEKVESLRVGGSKGTQKSGSSNRIEL